MEVTGEVVRRIAALARIRVDDAEVEGLVRDLGGILSHVEKLAALDEKRDGLRRGQGDARGGEGQPGTVPREDADWPEEAMAPTRSREIEPDRLAGGTPEDLAPRWRDGFFLVPRVPGMEEP